MIKDKIEVLKIGEGIVFYSKISEVKNVIAGIIDKNYTVSAIDEDRVHVLRVDFPANESSISVVRDWYNAVKPLKPVYVNFDIRLLRNYVGRLNKESGRVVSVKNDPSGIFITETVYDAENLSDNDLQSVIELLLIERDNRSETRENKLEPETIESQPMDQEYIDDENHEYGDTDNDFSDDEDFDMM